MEVLVTAIGQESKEIQVASGTCKVVTLNLKSGFNEFIVEAYDRLAQNLTDHPLSSSELYMADIQFVAYTCRDDSRKFMKAKLINISKI